MSLTVSLADCLQTKGNLVLTVLIIQHLAAHGLFDFLLAAQPHPVQPGARMVLLHKILVTSHHCGQIEGRETHVDGIFTFSIFPLHVCDFLSCAH